MTKGEGERVMTMVIEVKSAMRVVTTVKVLVMRRKTVAPKKVGVRGEKRTASTRTTTMMIEAVRTATRRSVEVKESEAVGREGWVGWWKEGEGG